MDDGIGPTGKFPEASLGFGDDGEIGIGVASDTDSGLVVVAFGAPVSWLAFDAAKARELAEALLLHANRLTETTN